MKNLIIMSLLIFPMLGISQAPQRINFQSVLRNTTGEVISNSSVSLRISILRGTTTGTLVYSETHAKMTDAGGLMSLQIGNGTAPSTDFTTIDWGGSAHFIKLEADFSGGNNYVLLGTQELMSVPYALYASYASKTDTSVLNLAARFLPLNNKLNIVDTTTMLSNYRTGLNNKVNIVDTVSMLQPYLRDADTTSMLLPYLRDADTTNMLTNYRTGINAKLNILDTASMLQPYLRDADTTSMLLPYLRNADTTAMLANYRTGINAKVNNADTSDMLNPYLRKADAVVSVETDPVFNASVAKGITGIDTAYWNRKLNLSDTSNMLANYRTGLNNKVNTADTSNMLTNYRTGLNNKLNIIDTSTMLSKYLRKADTSFLSERINTKLNSSDFPAGSATGNIMFFNGASWVNLPPGLDGQFLWMSSGKPEWGSVNFGCLAGTASSTPTLTWNTALTNITHATLGATGIGTASSLPTGVSASWSGNVLTISGTPSTGGIFNYTIPLTGTGCNSLNATGTITVVSTATLTSTAMSSIASTGASSGGNISSDGGATVSARGLVYSTSTNPTLSNTVLTISSGTGSFLGTLTGLSPITNYYIRAYATNSAGTAYGNEVSFTTLQTITDIDGNTYNTVQIENQVWMSENLKTSRYRNGGSIPNVTDNTLWSNSTIGAWSYYNNDETNNAIYGKLYNWYTTLGDTLCPSGWGVPSDAEWTTLTDSLGGESVAGGKMKSIGTAYWFNPNIDATNERVFSVLPGGYRSSSFGFYLKRASADLWSATETGGSYAWFRNLTNESGIVYRANFPKSVGASVRCLRD